MIFSILILILTLVLVGLIVAFAVKVLTEWGAPPILINLIYLIVAVMVIFMLINALQTGHFPSFRR